MPGDLTEREQLAAWYAEQVRAAAALCPDDLTGEGPGGSRAPTARRPAWVSPGGGR